MGRQQVRGTVIHEWDSHDIVVEEDNMHIQIILIQGVKKKWGKLRQTGLCFCIDTIDIMQRSELLKHVWNTTSSSHEVTQAVANQIKTTLFYHA